MNKRHIKRMTILLLLLVCAAYMQHVIANSLVQPISNSALSETSQKTTLSKVVTAEEAQVPILNINALQDILAAYPTIESSVAIISSDGQETVVGSTDPYVAASTTKVITAIAALQTYGLQQDSYIQGTSVKDLVTAMIVQSDNDSWYALVQDLGSSVHAIVASAAQAESYDYTANSITAADLARIYTELYDGNLLPSDSTEWLMNLLQQSNYQEFMYAVVPSDVAAYHKVGFLYDRLHEVVVVDTGTATFTVAVFTKTNTDYDFAEGRDLLQAIFKEVYAQLT